MKACRNWIVVTVLGTLLISATVFAQENSSDRWSISATLSSQFSNNRDGVASNKENNVDVAFVPRADLRWRDGERSLLDIFLTPSVVWHSNPRSEESGAPQDDAEMFYSGGIEAMHQFSSRFAVKGGDTLTYNDAPEVKLSGASDAVSSPHWLNTAHAGVDAAASEKVGVSVLGSARTKRYTDSEVADNQDEDTYQGEADLKYAMGSGYSVFGLVGWSDFNTESSGPATRERGSQVTSVGLGVDSVMSPDIAGRITGGYQLAEYDNPALDSSDTFNGNLSLVLRPASVTRFRVEGAYGYFSPNVSPYSIQTLTAVSAAIDHDVLPGRLTVTLHGQYSQGDYEAGDGLAGGKDNLSMGGVRANYSISRNWSVAAGYSYEDWDSTVRESFKRNLVDASVTARL